MALDRIRKMLVDQFGQLIGAENPLRMANGDPKVTTTTIASGASLSAEVDLDFTRLAYVIVPSGWTTAQVSFELVPVSAGTSYPVFDEVGSEVSITVTPGKATRVPFADHLGARRMKIRSGTSASPVNQGADRTITLVSA